jgi:hypothetical protein
MDDNRGHVFVSTGKRKSEVHGGDYMGIKWDSSAIKNENVPKTRSL